MENEGLPTTGLDPCAPFLALCVLAMGWAWAVFFAHSVLQAIFNRSVRSLEAGSQLIDGCVTPQLDKFSRLFWLYIDDFSCLQLEPRGRKPEDLAIHDVAAECKEAIEKKGLTVHKETAGHGVEASLGTTISPGVPMLSVLPEKQSRIEAATRALLERGEGSAAEVEHLLGVWIWMMLPVRLALSVPCAIYEFMRDFAGMAPQRLPKLVQAELWCLVFLLPLFAVDLSAGWHEWAYQVDASLEGYGAVATRSWPEELRGEAQYCERKGWVVEAEKVFSDFEESYWIVDDDGKRGLRPAPEPRMRNQQRFRGLLELFCGSGRFAAAVRAARLSWVEDWDILHCHHHDLTNVAAPKGLLHRI